MKDLALVILFLMALPVAALALALGYAAAIESVRGAWLSLGAMRARRKVRQAGGVDRLSDADLQFVSEKLSARMAVKPLYRRPRWLFWVYELKEQVDCQLLGREAHALTLG